MKESGSLFNCLYDALYELFGADAIDKKIESGEIKLHL